MYYIFHVLLYILYIYIYDTFKRIQFIYKGKMQAHKDTEDIFKYNRNNIHVYYGSAGLKEKKSTYKRIKLR